MIKKKLTKSDIKPEWKLLYESKNAHIDRLFDVYRLDKKKAKVLFSQNKDSYEKTRIVLFEWPDGSFKIVNIAKHFGISINGVLYNREKTINAIIYKDKKFYYQNGGKLVQLTFNYLKNFILQYTENSYNNMNASVISSETYCYFLKKFGWLRNLWDVNAAHHMSLNTITKNKLYNEKMLLRHLYSCPYPVAKMLAKTGQQDFKKIWAATKRSLTNIENLREEMINSHLFIDMTKMADSLGYKINCSWSMKRMKQEHDKWMREVVAVILEFEPLRELKINNIFKDFAKFSGYELLLTNHDLIAEGKMMNHCVGTYSDAIDNGKSGIYRVEGHTLELSIQRPYSNYDIELAKQCKSDLILRVNQLRGFSNDSAPKNLEEKVNEKVRQFNLNGFTFIKDTLITEFENFFN